MTKRLKSSEAPDGARHRILKASLKLFNARGIPKTGTEQIIAEADVAKMTFYRLFGSKSGLTQEFLKIRDDRFFEMIERHVNLAKDPESKVLAIFDGLHEWFQTPDFNGCIFIRGLFDFDSDVDEPELMRIFESHFTKFDRLLVSLVKPISPKDYRRINIQISSLVTGAIITAQATGSAEIAILSKELVRGLLK